jgi:hypothetical protein
MYVLKALLFVKDKSQLQIFNSHIKYLWVGFEPRIFFATSAFTSQNYGNSTTGEGKYPGNFPSVRLYSGASSVGHAKFPMIVIRSPCSNIQYYQV